MDTRGRTNREGALVVRQAVWAVTGAAGRPLRACRPSGIGPTKKDRLCDRPATPAEAADAIEVSPRAQGKRPASVTPSRPRPLLEKPKWFTLQIWAPSSSPPLIRLASPRTGQGSGEAR